MKDIRLLIPACVLWISALIIILAPTFQMDFIVKIGGVVILCAVLFAIICRKNIPKSIITQIVFCAILILLQFASFTLQTKAIFPSSDQVPTSNSTDFVIKITSTPSENQGFSGLNCRYQAESFAPHRFLTAEVSGSDECDLEYGAEYKATGSLKADDFHIKNAATLVMKKVELYKPPNLIDRGCNFLRMKFMDVVKDLPGNAPGLVAGMSIGDTRLLSKDLNDATKISGLTHLTAISGSHFVIIISLIGGILLAFKIKPRPRAIVQLIAIFALVALVHPSDSVKRAVIMSVIGLLGVFLNRRAMSISALAFTVCAWFIFDPWLACSYGFALSALATFSIVAFSAPCAIWLEKYIGKTAAVILSVPLVAQIGCYPVLLLMTDYLTPLAPLANILVTPAVEPGTIIALFSALISVINTPLASFLAGIAGFFTEWVANVAFFVNDLPFAKIVWIAGPIGTGILLILVGTFFASPNLYRKIYGIITHRAPREMSSAVSRLQRSREKSAMKVLKWVKGHAIVSAICLVLVSAVPISLIFFKDKLFFNANIPQTWVIAACNIGQGDAGIVRTGENSGILIDTGPPNRDTGGENIAQCLQKLRIERLNMLVISHFHDDHIGGVKDVLNAVPVDFALLDPVKQPENNANAVIKQLEAKNIRYKFATPNLTANSEDGLRNPGINESFITSNDGQKGVFGCAEDSNWCTKWQTVSVWDDKGVNGALFEDGKASNGKGAAEDDRENDSSIAMFFEVQGVKYWTSGDLELKGSKGALKAAKNLGISSTDVMKVNHHGSKTQDKNLLQTLNPLIAIYMDGKNNYGHPNPELIATLEGQGAKTLRTDLQGLCAVYLTENGELSTFSERE